MKIPQCKERPKTSAPIATPGYGAPPDREGLYWVRWVGDLTVMLIAVVEGEAPFMKVRLIDPFTSEVKVPSATLKISDLTWLGEIHKPVTTSAAGGTR